MLIEMEDVFCPYELNKTPLFLNIIKHNLYNLLDDIKAELLTVEENKIIDPGKECSVMILKGTISAVTTDGKVIILNENKVFGEGFYINQNKAYFTEYTAKTKSILLRFNYRLAMRPEKEFFFYHIALMANICRLAEIQNQEIGLAPEYEQLQQLYRELTVYGYKKDTQ